MDEAFLKGSYLGDVGRVADTALANRNRFIEWAVGIVTAIVFGALVARTVSPFLAWAASAFVAAFIMPMFSIAVVQHGYFVRYNSIRSAIIRLVRSPDAEKPDRLKYALALVDWCDLGAKNLDTRAKLVTDVFWLGFGYLIVASNAVFLWFSTTLLSELHALNPCGLELVLASLAIAATYSVIVRELNFLRSTKLLGYAGFKDFEDWKKQRLQNPALQPATALVEAKP